MKKALNIGVLLVLVLSLGGCGPKAYSGGGGTLSRDQTERFRLSSMFYEKLQKEWDFAYVPAGSFSYGLDEGHPLYSFDYRKRTVSVSGFYMQAHEVTNGQYAKFLAEMEKADSIEIGPLLPRTELWQYILGEDGKMHTGLPFNYFHNPDLRDFPVVNISYIAALSYCNWLERKIRAALGQGELSGISFYVRLPTAWEWTYAATNAGWLEEDQPQRSPSAPLVKKDLKGSKRDPMPRDTKGYTMNYVMARGANQIRASYYVDSSFVKLSRSGPSMPANIHHTGLNDLGLHGMSGNVREIVRAERMGDRYGRAVPIHGFDHSLDSAKIILKNWDSLLFATKGGGWVDDSLALNIHLNNYERFPNPFTGFRPVIIPIYPARDLTDDL